MSNSEIITNYMANVTAFYTITNQIAWNANHRLPLLTLPDQQADLAHKIKLFEALLATIRDWRTRNVLRARYGIGMSVQDAAAFMNLSGATISAITREALMQLDLTETPTL